MGKITIKDIAREANVSVGLVSMTLNGRSGVNAKTANAIMEVVKRLNYTPNKAASSLRIGFQKTIGVITPDLANHYFPMSPEISKTSRMTTATPSCSAVLTTALTKSAGWWMLFTLTA